MIKEIRGKTIEFVNPKNPKFSEIWLDNKYKIIGEQEENEGFEIVRITNFNNEILYSKNKKDGAELFNNIFIELTLPRSGDKIQKELSFVCKII
jgi:hypothetical protein